MIRRSSEQVSTDESKQKATDKSSKNDVSHEIHRVCVILELQMYSWYSQILWLVYVRHGSSTLYIMIIEYSSKELLKLTRSARRTCLARSRE